jgi:hypothetical protein
MARPYDHEYIREYTLPLRALGGLVGPNDRYGYCHCTHKPTGSDCRVSGQGGLRVLRDGETDWHGAFLCEKHARELNLLW